MSTTTAADPFGLTMKISKVDKEKRMVYGVASDETFDRQGDITDYTAAKALFTNPDAWPGNIREMHKPEAVGKAVEIDCDDANRTICIGVRVSKGAPNTWEKVLDGTLGFFSIGGKGKRIVEKTAGGQDAKRLFLTDLAEVSLVDNGANPTAKFEIVKMVDDKITTTENLGLEDEPAAKVLVFSSKMDLLNAVKGILTDVATATDPVKARVALDEIAKAVAADETIKKYCETYDIERAANLIVNLNYLLASEYYDALAAQQDGSTIDPAQAKAQANMLRQAGQLLVTFLTSEFNEQFNEAPSSPYAVFASDDSAVVEMAAKSMEAVVAKAGARHSAKDVEMIQKVHDLSGNLGAACAGDAEKAAKADEKKTDDEKAAADDKKAKDDKKKKDDEEDTEKVTKLQGELDAAKTELDGHKETVVKMTETVSALESRLKALEDQPMQGGPARMAVAAVEKTVGGEAPPAATEHDQVLKAFDVLAARAGTDQDKMQIARGKLSYMTENGLNTVERFDPTK